MMSKLPPLSTTVVGLVQELQQVGGAGPALHEPMLAIADENVHLQVCCYLVPEDRLHHLTRHRGQG